jgi:hypothetical protein
MILYCDALENPPKPIKALIEAVEEFKNGNKYED